MADHAFKSRKITYLVTLLNITPDNIINQVTHILFIVLTQQQLRKSSLQKIIVECRTPLGLNLGSERLLIESPICTIFTERERK